MKRLEDLSLLQRIALAVGIVIFTIIVLIFISWLVNAPAEGAPPLDLYGDIPYDKDLLARDKQALGEAYEEQIKHLFRIWLSGRAQSNKEISEGLKNARRAYGMARDQIESREKAK